MFSEEGFRKYSSENTLETSISQGWVASLDSGKKGGGRAAGKFEYGGENPIKGVEG